MLHMKEGLQGRFCSCDRSAAPGWAALDDRIVAVYGDLEPQYYGTTDPIALGGIDPVEAISAYLIDEPVPHWHLVSFGMSELYDKTYPAPDVSGFGFELTMRVLCTDGERGAPPWAMNMMQMLAQYVHATKIIFEPGDHMDCAGPIDPNSASNLTAVAFVDDPTLGSLETPNGFTRFLQVVGITADEHEVMMDWDPQAVLDMIAERDPMMLTDLSRPSLRSDPAVAAVIERRLQHEPSTASGAHGGDVRWQQGDGGVVVTLGAFYVKALRRGLLRRAAFDQPYLLEGEGRALRLMPSSDVAIAANDQLLDVLLTKDAARALAAAVKPKRGSYTCSEVAGLTVKIAPTEIKDDAGNVAEVIG
jgi:suppressor of fused-like protein